MRNVLGWLVKRALLMILIAAQVPSARLIARLTVANEPLPISSRTLRGQRGRGLSTHS